MFKFGKLFEENYKPMKTKTFLILTLVTVLYSCSSKLKELSQADADRGKQKFPAVTLASLNEGKSIYQLHCNKCHGLKKPSSANEAKWNKLVPIMVTKLNKKEGKEVIDAKQQEILLQYLITMGKK